MPTEDEHEERDEPASAELVRAEQVRAHYAQVPAMTFAPTAGGLFTAWVLWDSVDNRYLVVGMAVVALLSAIRLWFYWRYSLLPVPQRCATRWRVIAVAAALVSGCVWGSAAPFLYPPHQPQYAVYLVVLLTLLPIVPVAALAVYMPAFYAYYVPCLAPFVVMLALGDSRAEHLTALLLLMMMLAMLVFARRYSHSLAHAIGLRVQLARKSEALQAAMEHKTRFIAAASHDLRQPVHAMGLFLETLRSSGDAQVAKAVRYLEASQRSLHGMLGNMLDISRLDAGVVRPQMQAVAVGALLCRLHEEFAPQAAARNLILRCRPGAAVVRSDPVLLERILRNLLGNAIKYTPRGGVLLACRRCGGGISLQVYDTGVGIRPEDHGAVFDAFSQVRAGRVDADGLGLGLAIVRQTVELLGHSLRLRSVPGRGSLFALDIAWSPDVPALAAGGAPAAGAGDGRAGVPRGTAVIVDDDEAVREGTAALLAHWGLRVLSGASIEQTLTMLAREAHLPDVLLVDFRLAQGESGLTGVQAIRRQSGRDIPVILITGDTAPSRIREAYEAGHFLLHKPVDPRRLQACLTEALAAGP